MFLQTYINQITATSAPINENIRSTGKIVCRIQSQITKTVIKGLDEGNHYIFVSSNTPPPIHKNMILWRTWKEA